MKPDDRIAYGWLAHLIADWFTQNDWQARNKSQLGHPAGLLHAALHTLVQVPVLGPRRAIGVGVAHYAIDLRTPLRAWGRLIRQTPEIDPSNPAGPHVLMWRDQVAHLAVIALAVGMRAEHRAAPDPTTLPDYLA